MNEETTQLAEFCRLIEADHIGPQETVREVAANAAERVRLAERFGLLALDALAATLRLHRDRDGVIHVDGRFEADVVQACVVTLEAVPAHLAADVSVRFAKTSRPRAGELIIGLDEEEPPEELLNGRIDLGETVAQQLAVALDPYPRAAAAAGRFEAADDPENNAAERSTRPFAALQAWPRRPRGD